MSGSSSRKANREVSWSLTTSRIAGGPWMRSKLSVRFLLAGKKRIQPESKKVIGSSTNPIQSTELDWKKVWSYRNRQGYWLGKERELLVKIYTTNVWERKILISNKHKYIFRELQFDNDNRFKSRVVMKTKANAVKYDRLAGGDCMSATTCLGCSRSNLNELKTI